LDRVDNYWLWFALLILTRNWMCRHQGIGTFGNEGAAFGFSNIDQQLNGRPSASTTLNPFPAGGNPFGWY